MLSINNKKLESLYTQGMSLTQVAKQTDISVSTVRNRLMKAGIKLRTRKDGIKLASKQGRMSSKMKGKKRPPFSEKTRAKLSAARRCHAEKYARGVSLKPSGYLEYTHGPNKGRSVHDVLIEQSIGRHLRRGEVVHHIDMNKTNNDLENLQLMTNSEHARLHRLQDQHLRQRDKHGRYI